MIERVQRWATKCIMNDYGWSWAYACNVSTVILFCVSNLQSPSTHFRITTYITF